MKVVDALERAGVELIAEKSPSVGVGRGVRLRELQPRTTTVSASADAGRTVDSVA
jgi:hypothetical protein